LIKKEKKRNFSRKRKKKESLLVNTRSAWGAVVAGAPLRERTETFWV